MANMSIQLKDSSNNNLYPIPPNDYIVDQGTSGIWTYRKWDSGVAECWCADTGFTNITSAWGSTGLYTNGPDPISRSYPTGFFIVAPSCVGSFETTGYNYWVLAGSTLGSKDATQQWQLCRPSSQGDVGYRLNVYAKGKWK